MLLFEAFLYSLNSLFVTANPLTVNHNSITSCRSIIDFSCSKSEINSQKNKMFGLEYASDITCSFSYPLSSNYTSIIRNMLQSYMILSLYPNLDVIIVSTCSPNMSHNALTKAPLVFSYFQISFLMIYPAT